MGRGLGREVAAEFLGTLVLIAMGCGVNTAVTFGEGKAGDWLNVNFGWGVAVLLGIYVSAGISGAHLNPAVTWALAIFRDFPLSKVLPYMAAQVAGAFLGAALVYGTYYETFQHVDPDRSNVANTGVFCTYPAEHVSTFPGAFVDQVVGTAILLVLVLAVGDKQNVGAPSWFGPIVVALTVLGIGLSYGSNAGYAINPARDLGPRLLAYVAGWGNVVFTHRDYYFWVPIVGPLVGGVAGALVYDLLIARRHPPEE